ncbi:single-stranded DNA-binding protein [Chloroflexota bacterium]|nr:single-stranded DNA-binding protein [Chloroflexota bacterium]
MVIPEINTEYTSFESQSNTNFKETEHFYNVTVMGKIVAEPFIHNYPSGKCVCLFRIDKTAIGINANQSSYEKAIEYCAAYNEIGCDILNQCRLGDTIAIEGFLKFYSDRYGKTIYDLIVTNFINMSI